jgi:carbon starvation protein
MALLLVGTLLVKAQRARHAWVALLPATWILVVTLTAGWQKLFHDNDRIGFLAHADRFSAAAERGEVLAPAKSLAQMQQVIFNDRLDAALCALFMAVVLVMLFCCLRTMRQALTSGRASSSETAPVYASEPAA